MCAWIVAFFPIVSNTTVGLNSADRNLLMLFRLYGASPGQTLLYLRLPTALPYFLAGLRISGGLALIGAVVAEFVAGTGGAETGLAFRILEAGYRLAIPRMFAALFLLSLTGIVIYLVLDFLSRRLLRRWHESAAAPKRTDPPYPYLWSSRAVSIIPSDPVGSWDFCLPLYPVRIVLSQHRWGNEVGNGISLPPFRSPSGGGGTMARTGKLSAVEVTKAKGPAVLHDGGGLYLRVSARPALEVLGVPVPARRQAARHGAWTLPRYLARGGARKGGRAPEAAA